MVDGEKAALRQIEKRLAGMGRNQEKAGKEDLEEAIGEPERCKVLVEADLFGQELGEAFGIEEMARCWLESLVSLEERERLDMECKIEGGSVMMCLGSAREEDLWSMPDRFAAAVRLLAGTDREISETEWPQGGLPEVSLLRRMSGSESVKVCIETLALEGGVDEALSEDKCSEDEDAPGVVSMDLGSRQDWSMAMPKWVPCDPGSEMEFIVDRVTKHVERALAEAGQEPQIIVAFAGGAAAPMMTVVQDPRLPRLASVEALAAAAQEGVRKALSSGQAAALAQMGKLCGDKAQALAAPVQRKGLLLH